MSSSSSSPPLGDRFTIVTDDDHRGVIWVVSILCIIYALMIMVLRGAAKRTNFGWDDWLAVAATAFAVLQYITIFIATQHGLGRSFSSITASDGGVVGRSLLASEVLLLTSLSLAKCSVICLCRRLFSTTMHKRLILCDITMGICGLWGIASIIAIVVDCPPLKLIGFRQSFCPSLVTRWKAIGALDSVTEVMIVLLSLLVVWPLQMSLTRKVQALVSFFLRLLIIIFAIVHVTTLSRSLNDSNKGVALTTPSIYLQIELLYALISSAIPALNHWLRKFDSSMGTTWVEAYGSHAYGSNDRTDKSGGQNIQMNSMTSMKNSKAKLKAPETTGSDSLTAWKDQYSVSCERQNKTDTHSTHSHEEQSNKSINSADMIIRKDVTWRVQHED